MFFFYGAISYYRLVDIVEVNIKLFVILRIFVIFRRGGDVYGENLNGILSNDL